MTTHTLYLIACAAPPARRLHFPVSTAQKVTQPVVPGIGRTAVVETDGILPSATRDDHRIGSPSYHRISTQSVARFSYWDYSHHRFLACLRCQAQWSKRSASDATASINALCCTGRGAS